MSRAHIFLLSFLFPSSHLKVKWPCPVRPSSYFEGTHKKCWSSHTLLPSRPLMTDWEGRWKSERKGGGKKREGKRAPFRVRPPLYSLLSLSHSLLLSCRLFEARRADKLSKGGEKRRGERREEKAECRLTHRKL